MKRWTKFNQLYLVFFVLSLLGWIVETVYCFFRFDELVMRGFLTLPLCPIYGLTMVSIYLLFGTRKEGGALLGACRSQPLRTVLYCIVTFLSPTVAELLTGIFFHRLFDLRLWDYTMQKYNLGGYICLKFSVLFGTLILLAMLVAFPFVKKTVEKLPKRGVNVSASILLVVVLLDFFTQLIKLAA